MRAATVSGPLEGARARARPADLLRAHPALGAAVVLTVVAAVAKLAYWRVALGEDPGAYIYVGRGLLHGDTPYVDAAEPKGPVTHLLYGVIGELAGGRVLVVQIAGLLL